MKKIFFSYVCAVLCLFMGAVVVHANAGTPTSADQSARNKARQNILGLMNEGKLSTIVRPTGTAIRQDIKADRCELVTSRINARLNLYSNNKDNVNQRYDQYKNVVANKLATWKAKGCDTTTVAADLVTLDQKITTFAAAFRDFQTSLQGTREFVCGASQGKFAGQVTDARQKQLVMKQTAVTLRDFVINTLRPHVKTLRAACEPVVTPSHQVTGDGK